MTVWAFIDESGDPNLDVDAGGTTHFAVGAIVVRDDELQARRECVDGVRQRYFQTGAIKSQSVGANIPRRLKVLEGLQQAGCRFLGLVVDKRRLDRSTGLRFRQVFMKYLGRFLYERLVRAYPSLRVRADRHGRPEFMQSFRAYLAKHSPQIDLFSAAPEFAHIPSADEVLVQAADFVAGSLRIAYGDDIAEEDARAILSTLRPVSLGVQEWPAAVRTQSVLPEDETGDEHLDALVAQAAERSAYAFLEHAVDAYDETRRMQVEVLQELLGSLRFDESSYISGDALAERLRERGYPECFRDQVRRSIIAPMRDREVLVVSSARGYSLASGLADVETYLERMEEEIRPILRRVQTMDLMLRRATVGRVDLLEGERFRYVRALLEAHENCERAMGDAAPEASA